jgi:phosphatidyl-myo-inositol alpha-mannosyltransferase
VIPNGVDTELFVPGAGGDGRTLAFMGRFDPRNGLALLLDAFVQLRRAGLQLRLLAIGDGPLAGALHRRTPADLRGDICWAGRVDMTRPRLLARSTLLCSPCHRSAFGLVVLEAMSCGLPVVAVPSDGARLLVDHEGTGLIAGEPAGLAEAIARLADDPAGRRAMGVKARRVAVEGYSWRTIGVRLAGYYEQILAGEPGLSEAAVSEPLPSLP